MKTFTFLISLVLLTSCSIIKTSMLADAEEATVTTIATTPKDVKFIGVAHIAKPELYASVREEILKLKKDGYVLFYEWIDFSFAPDDVLRKTRKLVGFIPDKKGYADAVEEGQVQQNNDDFLGLENNLDFNVDISAYEEKFGALILDSTDINTPIDQKIVATEPIMQTLDIILKYRNEHVVKEIKKSSYPKIIVLYGALHEKGMKKLLKN